MTAISHRVKVGESWSDRAALRFTARLSVDTIHAARLYVTLVGSEGLWYQSARSVVLKRMEPTTVSLDLGPDSGDWVPTGHLRPWDGYVTRHVQAVGLKCFSDGQLDSWVMVEDVGLLRDGAPGRERLRLLDFHAPRRLAVGRCCEIRFRLNRTFGNPFDPSQVDVQARFEVPGDGAAVRAVPGFFYQRYVPRWEGERVRRVPAGPAQWRVRFWPDRPGEHRCDIEVQAGGATARVPWAFQVDPAPEGRERPANAVAMPADELRERLGRLLGDCVVARDYNGKDPFYIWRPPKWRADGSTPPEGTLHAWRVPLEWSGKWGGYGGLGRYNLAAASAFEDLLDRAAARGIALPLALTCNEPFGDRAKFNWELNPLNVEEGGPLEAPSHFYTSSQARRWFRRGCRYVLARWGGHPAVASWELWCTLPANGAGAWHRRVAGELARWRGEARPLRSHHPQTLPPASAELLDSFRRKEVAWRTHQVIPHTTKSLRTATEHASEGEAALEVVARYPGEAAIVRPIAEERNDWHTYDRLAFDVFVPKTTPQGKPVPNDMRVMVYLRDADLWWYETLLPTYLRPGDWTKLLVDLTGEITDWQPRGHDKVFSRYALQRVRVLGIRVFGHRDYEGPLYIDNIQLSRDPVRQARRKGRVKVTYVRPNRVTVPQHEKFELTFRLSRVFANPFDPEEADVVGHFVPPSQQRAEKPRTIDVPAFFYQDYERKLVEGREVLTPRGLPCWKLRFTPAEPGPYTYSVSVNGQRLVRITSQHFDCVPSSRPGFVRRSEADRRYFELSTGQFFYPIGMNLRSPSDNREPYDYPFPLPEGRGTYAYDDYYRKLAENGINWARIWQCPWWCGLQWTRQWPGYQGLGRYNLENAWRFDYCLEEAAKRGIYVQVCLTNHGQITVDPNIDRQWDSNPLWQKLGEGGPLERAAQFYTNDRAKALFRQRLRYTVARWGYSPHLMAWALFSEMEFTEAYWDDAGAKGDDEGDVRCPQVARWVGEMAAHLKRIDPFHHLVTTHFSHPWRGHEVWQRPELDIVQSNAYSAFQPLGGDWGDRSSGDVARAIEIYYHRFMGRHRRPVLIAEYGGHWMRNPPQRLEAELHCGTWASVTSHLAGATGYWWWLYVHFADGQEDHYRHYRAAARFMAGEDRRGLDLRQEYTRGRARGTFLRVRALRNRQVATLWVYHPLVVRTLEGHPPVKEGRVDLRDFQPGRYRVEFWNTYTGEVVARAEVQSDGERLRLDLPEFRNDIAVKVRPAK
ncbi:MAG: DUF5060 domain-containing protein [Candidatus Brocadiia bacterium]